VNEAQFIKSLGGIVIRIESEIRNYKKMKDEAFKNFSSEKDIDKIIQLIKNHTSETNLDIYTFNYTINNEPDNTENIANEIDLILDTFIKLSSEFILLFISSSSSTILCLSFEIKSSFKVQLLHFSISSYNLFISSISNK
jgi:nitrogen regulatory protein PII-like uncharacterized protein